MNPKGGRIISSRKDGSPGKHRGLKATGVRGGGEGGGTMQFTKAYPKL